jgi:hypothetical protein
MDDGDPVTGVECIAQLLGHYDDAKTGTQDDNVSHQLLRAKAHRTGLEVFLM